MSERATLIIKAISPLHNGSGESLGVVDRPVMRERFTDFPIVQGSSIKGVLRWWFKEKLNGSGNGEKVEVVFGPEPGRGQEHAGAVCFGDAKLLSFPIRCIGGPFVWATSPLALHRAAEVLTLCGQPLGQSITNFIQNVIPLTKPSVAENAGDLMVGPQNDRRILAEEYSFAVNTDPIPDSLVQEIASFIFSDDETFSKTYFNRRFIVLPDEIFVYFITHATEVMPNIRIGEKGTTEEGSLRYTEYLPEETILYSLIEFESGKGKQAMSSNDVKGYVAGNLPQVIQLGADETIGKGLVKLTLRHGG